MTEKQQSTVVLLTHCPGWVDHYNALVVQLLEERVTQPA